MSIMCANLVLDNSGASAATLAEHNVQNSPSCCLLLNNLFDHHDVDLKKEPSFFLDVKEDVIGLFFLF
jgi:hypothetical protein